MQQKHYNEYVTCCFIECCNGLIAVKSYQLPVILSDGYFFLYLL